MKKKFDSWGEYVKKIPLQGLLCLFILCCGLQTYAQQEGAKIDINVKEASVKDVLDVIKKRDYRLVYSTASVDACTKKVTLNMKNATVSQILDKALDGTGLSYKVEGKLVTIKKVEQEEQVVAMGVVKDVKGNPLPGVTVMVKGLRVGTSTDQNGKYAIKVAKNSTLVFSFIGMESKEIMVESNTPQEITLKDVANEMEEVVITGYQVIKKRESTSSIISMNAEDIIEPVGNSLDQMLQGKIPGMSVMLQTSTVGAAPKIRIRGSSSIIGNREPVWVVDGIVLEDPVKLDATELNSFDRVNLIGNAISGLNPEDIERIDVLKDASATAIYGVKAANGVIVITTKRGKQGPPSIRYSTSMSFLQRPNYDKLDMMNSKERMELSEEIFNRGLQFSGFCGSGIGYEGQLLDLWNGKISMNEFNDNVKRLKEVNTDWYKLLFRNSFSQNHTLSASGATEKMDYYFSAGYSNQQGAPLQENSERYNFMSNLGMKFSDKLSVSVGLSANVSTTNRPTVDLYQYAYNTSRAIPAYNADGSYSIYEYDKPMGSPYVLTFNVLNELDNTGSKTTARNINTNINVTYKIMSGLSANAVLSYNTSVTDAETYAGEKSYQASTYRKTPYGFVFTNTADDNKEYADFREKICELPYGGLLDVSNTSNNSFLGRASMDFNKMLYDVHSISFNAGFEIKTSKYTGTDATYFGYLPERGKKFTYLTNPDKWPYAVKKMQAKVPMVTDNVSNTISFYAAAAYSYKGKYIISANVRGDASNKLGSDKSARFLPIWSFSGRWNVSDEFFMEPVKGVLSSFAIRGSLGLQGNVTDAHNPNMIIGLGALDTKSEEYQATIMSLPNHGLRWEKTTSKNIGIDFSLFRGILSGCFEYYSKIGKDQLLSVEVESTNGKKSVTINGGDMNNKGWELSFGITPIQTKNVTWGLTFNTSKNYNKVTNAGDRSFTYDDYLSGSLIKNGYAVNSFNSYRFGGLDSYGIPIFQGIKERDADGKLVLDTKEKAFASAMVYSGKREADLTGGLSTYVKVKNFSVNMMFALSFGSKIRLNDLYEIKGTSFVLPYPGQNMSNVFVDRWRKPGDEKITNIPVLTDKYYSISTLAGDGITGADGPVTTVAKDAWQMYNASDLRVVSGNFLRCRSISMNYSIPSEFLKKCYIQSASLGLGISNPFVIKSKELKGRDPEQVTMGSGTIPPSQTYSFNLNVTF